MDTLESEEQREKKRKLEERCEGKSTRPSEDAVFLRREIVDALKRCRMKEWKVTRRKQMKRWIKFLQTITDSVATQLQGMNTTIAKMKEEGEDRYKQINERIANMEKKISVMDEKSENRSDETNRTHDDQNQGKAVATGFHGETSESEVEQLLRETTTEIGMSIENARIECPAKPITHAFIYFKNDDERNKYVRSANMLRKVLRGRKIKMSRSMERRRKISSEKTADMSNTAFT